jgi:hypothetical protein
MPELTATKLLATDRQVSPRKARISWPLAPIAIHVWLKEMQRSLNPSERSDTQ